MVTREQAAEQLKVVGVENPTDEQITTYLNNVNAEAIKEKSKADSYKAKADKADAFEKELNDLKDQNLSDDEKRQKEKAELEQKVAELTASSFKSEAKAILKGAGMDDESIEALLPGMIADTLENTQARANAYVSAMNKSIETAIKNREKEELNNTNTPGGENGGDEETDDVKNAESLSFGGVDKNAQTARDYYK